MHATTYSAAVQGIDARLVTVEADVHPGLPRVTIVGMPDTAVQEAKERICSAVKNSGLIFPYQRITFNLSPADWRKEGSGFDLPVTVALLVATEQLPAVFDEYILIGELSLAGEVRPTRGILSIAELARKLGKKIIVPAANADEAASLSGLKVIPLKHLGELVQWIRSGRSWPTVREKPISFTTAPPLNRWSSIQGQSQAKRAITIAAVGHHNVLMVGAPGSGKTMLAQSLTEILPPLTESESFLVTKIHSVAGRLGSGQGLITARPFRQPHHTASVASLVGGGRIPKPGELTLAHHGVLFLDEFPEFSRDHIEALRQPLEDGVVTVSRVAGSTEFPAASMLVAAMNPCPCGWLHDRQRACTCSPTLIRRYHQRLSGPILDRFDIFLHVPRLERREIEKMQTVDDPRQKISNARQAQIRRQGEVTNSRMEIKKLMAVCQLEADGQDFLHAAMDRMQFSMRAYHRILRVSRSIADLDGYEKVGVSQIAEALQYRPPNLLQSY